MSKYKIYNNTDDPLATVPKDAALLTKNVASINDINIADYATAQAFHNAHSCIVLNLDSANEITLTYNHNTYTLDKDRLFMFLTTMFMKED